MALGFAGVLAAGALAAAGFLAKVCFFFAGAASGVGSGPNFTSGGSGTYGIGVVAGCGGKSTLTGTGHPGCPGWCVVELGGSTLYGAVTASRG